MLNGINIYGKIPAVWKKARVVLIPKPGKDLATSSAYRPISILSALSKMWEHTLKMLIERSIGQDPFHRDQYGFRRRRGLLKPWIGRPQLLKSTEGRAWCAFWSPLM